MNKKISFAHVRQYATMCRMSDSVSVTLFLAAVITIPLAGVYRAYRAGWKLAESLGLLLLVYFGLFMVLFCLSWIYG
jgi:uncharacterized membrane protein